MRWLERDLIVGPYLALVTNEADFHKAMRHLKVPRDKWAEWLPDDCYGRTHVLTNERGSVACLVCVRVGEQSGIEAAATLIHEGVHVWQAWCDYRGESAPSREFEAYAIEGVAKRLLQAYSERLPR